MASARALDERRTFDCMPPEGEKRHAHNYRGLRRPLQTRVPLELHQAVHEAASAEDISVTDWMIEALEARLVERAALPPVAKESEAA